jgi:hypothetical protein
VGSLVSRSGISTPQVVILDNSSSYYTPYYNYNYTDNVPFYKTLYLFHAGVDQEESTNSQGETISVGLRVLARAEFGLRLRELLMNRYFDGVLRDYERDRGNYAATIYVSSLNGTLTVSGNNIHGQPLSVSHNSIRQACAGIDDPVLVYEHPIEPVDPFLDFLRACNKGYARLVTTDPSIAEHLERFSVQDFTNLTVYYPADATPTARRCKDVATQDFPHPREGICADADMVTEFSYQAVLNAAGKESFSVHEMKTDRNQWITAPAQW